MISLFSRRARLWTALIGVAVAGLSDGVARISARGRWVFMPDGRPAVTDEIIRGLQPSGLTWDGARLWSVGDQRSAFPGAICVIDPQSGWLECAPLPLRAREPALAQRLTAWGRIDAEAIKFLTVEPKRLVVLVEADAMAALVVHVDAMHRQATVEAIWEFQFSQDEYPEPYRADPNFRFEGIAIDSERGRVFAGFERDRAGLPRIYHFKLPPSTTPAILLVLLAPFPFNAWEQLGGKPGALLNVNDLDFVRTPSGEGRLFVLCRDREMFFVLDSETAQIIGQVSLDPRSPDGDAIEWASPEGLAVDARCKRVFLISDPDSTDGNWRLRSTPTALGLFRQFVPLVFEIPCPPQFLE